MGVGQTPVGIQRRSAFIAKPGSKLGLENDITKKFELKKEKLNPLSEKNTKEFTKGPAAKNPNPGTVGSAAKKPNPGTVKKPTIPAPGVNLENYNPPPPKTKADFAKGPTLTGAQNRKRLVNQLKNTDVMKGVKSLKTEIANTTFNTIKSMLGEKAAKGLAFMAKGISKMPGFVAKAAYTITVGHFFETAQTIKDCTKEINWASKSKDDIKGIKDEKIKEFKTFKSDSKGNSGKIEKFLSKLQDTLKQEGKDDVADKMGLGTPTNDNPEASIKDQLELLKELADNDTKGDFISLHDEFSSMIGEMDNLLDEINTLEALESMDSTQKSLFITDKTMESTAAVGNSMWSAGFTASFVFPPAAGIAALGGAVFLASKAVKLVSNSVQYAYTKTNNSGAMKLDDKLKNIAGSLSNLSTQNQDVSGDVIKILNNDDYAQFQKEEKINDILNNINGDETKDALNDIKKGLEDIYNTTQQDGVQDKALKTAVWDGINMVTWAMLIYAGGAGAESFGQSGSIGEGGQAFIDHMSDPTNWSSQVTDAGVFAEGTAEGAQAYGESINTGSASEFFQSVATHFSTDGMFDWITEAVLFLDESKVQSEGGRVQHTIEQRVEDDGKTLETVASYKNNMPNNLMRQLTRYMSSFKS
jgi:hypothetical protein